MKTKLLLLLILTFTFTNAQVNVNEGFESGAIPTGWGNNNFSINNSIACSGSYSCSFTTSGLGSGAEISTPTYTSTGSSITISADYRRSTTGSSGAIFYLQYYNFNTSNWITITTTTSFTTTCQTLSATIPAGTIPAGTNVAFKMYIYSTGSSFVFYVDNILVLENVPQTIAEYNFNNTYNNVLGTTPFSTNGGTSFTTDRNGNANAAININNLGTTATILGLPYGAADRSISVWVKTNILNSQINYVFHYGNTANGNGCAFRPTETLFFAGSGGNLIHSGTNTNATWVHYVCTYNGTTAKIYKDGILLTSATVTWNTVNNSNIFKLGLTESGLQSYFNGAIDDLKIFNYALSDTEITNLFTNNALASQDFNANNLKVTLYPNPTKNIFTIATDAEIAIVEIYSPQGQKVLTASQRSIDISNLSSGVYFVKIQSIDKIQTIQKIVKQ